MAAKPGLMGITVRFEPSLYKRVASRAEAEGRSINQEIIKLVQAGLSSGNQEVLLQESLARLQKTQADLEARMSSLEAEREGELRRMRDEDVAVTDVTEQPAGAKY
jgi:hypothetical protein